MVRPTPRAAADVDIVLTWGNKETGKAAQRYAARYDKPLWRIEDGFFRSVRGGPQTAPLSLVLDDRGIYYDARRPSRLEDILNCEGASDPLASKELSSRAERAIEFVLRERLSKYNDASAVTPVRGSRPRVLIVDQTFGDASVRDGLVDEHCFPRMLEWALERFPGAQILVKTHPDVIAGRKKGYLTAPARNEPRVELHAQHDNPVALLASVDHVVTATSQLGFEALLQGKPVTCFGAPFYSGWGLTEDRVTVPRRKARRSLAQLVAAAWLLYPRYVDPVSGRRCELEDVLEHLALQRRTFEKNARRTVAVGFSPWKRRTVEKFLESPGVELQFAREEDLGKKVKLARGDRVVVWGQRASSGLKARCERQGVALARMEDGFLRSVELGSDLSPASSLVLDERGMYYDPTGPSDLELMLETRAFTEEERRRGALLRAKIVRERLSKYNVQDDVRLALPSTEKRRVLIVGQVDDDASVQLGAAQVGSNGALVAAVRKARPDAFLIYKPHPDVYSGNRRGALPRDVEGLLDHVETRASSIACLESVDEVHTMTSLVGFEALLRNLPVSTYGLPFYAGWGLTQDHEVCPRRTRVLALDDLVFATLVEYPTYYSAHCDCFVSAEQMVDELAREVRRTGRADAKPSLRRKVVRLGRYLRGRLRAW